MSAEPKEYFLSWGMPMHHMSCPAIRHGEVGPCECNLAQRLNEWELDMKRPFVEKRLYDQARLERDQARLERDQARLECDKLKAALECIGGVKE